MYTPDFYHAVNRGALKSAQTLIQFVDIYQRFTEFIKNQNSPWPLWADLP